MTALLASLLVSTAGVTLTDDQLAAHLGRPEYPVRVWAQGKLRARLEGARTVTQFDRAAAAVTKAAASPDIQVRHLAGGLLAIRDDCRLGMYLKMMDDMTGGYYPCVDAWRYRDGGYVLPVTIPHLDECPPVPETAGPVFRTDYRDYGHMRWQTRYVMARLLMDGADPWLVSVELDRMHTVDAIWFVRVKAPWKAPDPVPYVVALFRWDCGLYGNGPTVTPAPTPVPQQMPAP